jgi:hypothetical protein
MRDWHVKHMQNTVVIYLTGLSEDASRHQRRLHKKYGGITKVRRRIQYDLKQGATNYDLMVFLRMIKKDRAFIQLRNNEGFEDRLNELESYFLPIDSHRIIP